MLEHSRSTMNSMSFLLNRDDDIMNFADSIHPTQKYKVITF